MATMVVRFLLGILSALFLCTIPYSTVFAQVDTAPVKIAFLGDQEMRAESHAVLQAIREEGVQLVVIVGDFDYHDDPAGYTAMLAQELTQYNIPYIATIGNHDLTKWPEYSKKFQEQLARFPEVKCEGEFGIESVCTYKGAAIILSGIGTYSNGHTNQTYMTALQNRLVAQKDTVWKMCVWHKNHSTMQLGEKKDEVPISAYDLCREQGALIITAHEHTYHRTRTLKSMANQQVDPEFPDAQNVMVRPGSSFVTVTGLGGSSIRHQARCLPATFPYGCNNVWGSVLTTNQKATYGAFIIEFRANNDPRKAEGYFRSISKKPELRIIDSIHIRSFSGAVPADKLPGDIDANNVIDIFDYNIVIQQFGQTGAAGFIPADIVQDGVINIFDYNKVIENFGKKAS